MANADSSGKFQTSWSDLTVVDPETGENVPIPTQEMSAEEHEKYHGPKSWRKLTDEEMKLVAEGRGGNIRV
jgi:hypothetical protein